MTAEDELKFTPSERDAFEELKKRMAKELANADMLKIKIYEEDDILRRYLIAREFDVDQAEDMLRKTLQWRKQNQIDTILTDYKPPEVTRIACENTLICYAKDRAPVFYFPHGKYDVKGVLMSAKIIDVEKTIIQVVEDTEKHIVKESKKLNKKIPGHVHIYDVEGLTFATATDKKAIETFIRLIRVQQDHYPERMRYIFVINASSLFTFPFAIIKNFLSPKLQEKVHVFGTDGWQEELLKLIDADQLPAFLGGKKTDPDGNPLCLTFTNHGGKVPEKFYIHKSKKSLSSSPGVKKLVLARASFSEVELVIKEAGSLIEWEFETKTRDIGFGLFYKEMVDGEERVRELVALQRLDTEDYAETGMYKCQEAGEYVILFDNSYSWIRSKEIFYKITIISPTEHNNRMKC